MNTPPMNHRIDFTTFTTDSLLDMARYAVLVESIQPQLVLELISRLAAHESDQETVEETTDNKARRIATEHHQRGSIKIEAIKAVRSECGLGLKDAKDAVDRLGLKWMTRDEWWANQRVRQIHSDGGSMVSAIRVLRAYDPNLSFAAAATAISKDETLTRWFGLELTEKIQHMVSDAHADGSTRDAALNKIRGSYGLTKDEGRELIAGLDLNWPTLIDALLKDLYLGGFNRLTAIRRLRHEYRDMTFSTASHIVMDSELWGSSSLASEARLTVLSAQSRGMSYDTALSEICCFYGLTTDEGMDVINELTLSWPVSKPSDSGDSGDPSDTAPSSTIEMRDRIRTYDSRGMSQLEATRQLAKDYPEMDFIAASCHIAASGLWGKTDIADAAGDIVYHRHGEGWTRKQVEGWICDIFSLSMDEARIIIDSLKLEWSDEYSSDETWDPEDSRRWYMHQK